jgi:hypothetical protein
MSFARIRGFGWHRGWLPRGSDQSAKGMFGLGDFDPGLCRQLSTLTGTGDATRNQMTFPSPPRLLGIRFAGQLADDRHFPFSIRFSVCIENLVKPYGRFLQRVRSVP